ncbi:MAG: hypothetical protein Kow00103_04400 [Candidatus Caldatribacteriota bacterium]
MLGLLETGSGFWNAVIWLVIILVLGALIVYFRNKGEASYKKSTEQDKPFISGNPELNKEDSHLSASHIYWGFTEALKDYYHPLIDFHTGNINDYTGWIIVVTVLVLIMVGVSG